MHANRSEPQLAPSPESISSMPHPEPRTLYLREPFNLTFTTHLGFVLKTWHEGTRTYTPPEWPFESLVVRARRGIISVTALHELQRLGTSVSLLNQFGQSVGEFTPHTRTKQPDLWLRQMRASADPKAAASIGRRILQAKLDNGGWLREAPKVPALDVRQLRAFESKHAELYFAAFREKVREVWPDSTFQIRGHKNHGYKMRTTERVNALANFGYSLLESRARTLLARVGLSPYFGFLHSALPDKEAAVYDLQEFERAAVDKAILSIASDPYTQRHGFLKTSEWVYRLTQETIAEVVKAVDKEFAERTDSGTVEGRFWREALALRSWIHTAGRASARVLSSD
jgi:CRISPR-associated endonuclease Cas1